MTAIPPAHGHSLLWIFVLAGVAAAAVAYAGLLSAPPMPLVKADGLDDEDRIVLAAYEYKIRGFYGGSESTFCLARGGLSVERVSFGVERVAFGDGPSPAVVAALAARGYDVVSASDCVRRDVGGSLAAFAWASRCPTVIPYLGSIAALASGSRCPAVILYVGPVEIGATGIAAVEVSHWYDILGCGGQRLRFSSDGRLLGPGERTFIC